MEALPAVISSVATLVVAITSFVVVLRKLREVHVLVNSQLTKVQTDLVMATKRIDDLQAFIAARRKSGELPPSPPGHDPEA